MTKKWILLISVFLFFTTNVYAQNETVARDKETIVFMRHGEKPTLDFGQLNCKGLNRSLALPRVLINKFGQPDFIFAANPFLRGYYFYVRAFVTIEPLAIQLQMPVNAKFLYYNDDEVANELLSEKYHHSLVFVSWEHFFITVVSKKIMTLLGQNEDIIPTWPDDDYDSLYVINVDWRQPKPVVDFIHAQQMLDGQSSQCPVPDPKWRPNLLGKQTLVFIPQAEFNSRLPEQLTCQGLNRALALPKVLSTLYPMINMFILPYPDPKDPQWDSTNHLLSLITIEPIVINRGALYIPTGQASIDSLIEYLRDPSICDQTIAISWPNPQIANLARAIYQDAGGNPKDIPNPLPNIDTMYQITIDRINRNKKPFFAQIPQKLNAQSTICPTR